MSLRFSMLGTAIPGVTVLTRERLVDDRGFLERLFCREELSGLLKAKSIAQINHTMTAEAGTVRGMHFQLPPHAETKLVTCLQGAVFDVAVDLRRRSSTFLSWHAEVLSADNRKTLIIPEGVAHGFQSLGDHCAMLYLHTAAYAADAEGGLNARDPLLAIAWPRTITRQSQRDRDHPMLNRDFEGIAL